MRIFFNISLVILLIPKWLDSAARSIRWLMALLQCTMLPDAVNGWITWCFIAVFPAYVLETTVQSYVGLVNIIEFLSTHFEYIWTIADNLCLYHNSLKNIVALAAIWIPFELIRSEILHVFFCFVLFFKYATYVTHGANRSKVVHSSIYPSNIHKTHIPKQGHWLFWLFTSHIGCLHSIIDNPSIMGHLLLLY